jgi:3'-phosphoadenosine 5'-phosphosulfate sulfotransferase (PAPS reductase)/FAD synthetase
LDKNNPYLLDTPAVISFSGGRTSGYMLWHVLQAFGGTLPDGVKVVFCNTGKERPETLDFVERCSQRWGVPVVWLEYRCERGGKRAKHTFAVVDYAAASRNGEPFVAAVAARSGDSGYLPNVVSRYCTIDLKVKTAIRYLVSIGWDRWTNAVGFRADEPQRVAKLSGSNRIPREDTVCPLFKAGVASRDVLAWWKVQPFDLALEPHESNCDLCFLKGTGKLTRIMRDRPDLAAWWIAREAGGARFRNDRPSYAKMLELSQRPGLFDAAEPDELSIACHCTD